MESTPLYSFFNVCAPPTRLLHLSEGGGGGEANGGRLRMRFIFFSHRRRVPTISPISRRRTSPAALDLLPLHILLPLNCDTFYFISPSPPATLPPPGLLLLLLLLLYSPVVLFSRTLYIKHTVSGEIKESRRPGTVGEEIEAAG